jgi:hypothetical protein
MSNQRMSHKRWVGTHVEPKYTPWPVDWDIRRTVVCPRTALGHTSNRRMSHNRWLKKYIEPVCVSPSLPRDTRSTYTRPQPIVCWLHIFIVHRWTRARVSRCSCSRRIAAPAGGRQIVRFPICAENVEWVKPGTTDGKTHARVCIVAVPGQGRPPPRRRFQW